MEGRDRLRHEFLSEAQELVESFGRDLLVTSNTWSAQPEATDPELINSLFRAVHTLKGNAYTNGADAVGDVSSALENVLNKLRLGQIELTLDVLNVLFDSAEIYPRLLSAERDGREPPREEIDGLLARIRRLLGAGEAPPPEEPVLARELLDALTEYEEHRLRTCLAEGRSLYLLKTVFNLMTIDRDLAGVKEVAKPFGEVITTLPASSPADELDPDALGLDLLFASRASAEELSGALSGKGARVEEIPLGRPRARTEMPPRSEPPPDIPVENTPDSRGPASIVPRAPESHLPPARRPASAESFQSVVQTVRVDIQKLNRLMNIVGELGIVRSQLTRMIERLRAAEADRGVTNDLHRLQRSFERHLGAMQHGVLEVRMVPLEQVFSKVAVEVRKISRDLGKLVNLVITGAETEVDKLVGEALTAPLQHLINNAIDHGLEPEAEREAAGKPPAGTIALNAFQKGSHVVIELEDDGKGIDTERLLEKAIERGFLRREDARALSLREVLNLIFVPGLTTRATATKFSGRGVGMDVVKTDIAKVGGIIDISSEGGIGTKITITIPITLAIINALMVRCEDRLFAIPMANVEEAVALDASLVRQIDGREMVTLRGRTLPLCVLRRFFDLGGGGAPGGEGRPRRPFIVVTSVGSHRLGLVVESLVGEQDIVIKALGPSLAAVRGFSGATELGDQRIALVLDVQALAEEVLSTAEWGRIDAGRARG